MSYPRLIQTLVIEDESTKLYEAVFDPLIRDGSLAPLRYAYCFRDAHRILRSDKIVHLVILDLRLPELPGRPPQEGLDHGLELLDQCTRRDDYPIPALLVISGHIGQADQRDLDSRVRGGFYHGRVLVKGPQLQAGLLEAVQAVQDYCGVGIHIRDAEERMYPTLSPREDDLLRRCVLRQRNCTGVDLEWWSAEYQRPSGHYSHCMGWTKTLSGRFLLHGDRPSRPNFFKLAPAGGAESVLGDAELMQHKLEHIKVWGALIAGGRSLLVTQKVGANDDRPISLAEYLIRPAELVMKRLPHVIEAVAAQVEALGDSTPHRCSVGDLLWSDHNTKRLEEQWQLYGGEKLLTELGAEADPLLLFRELSSNCKELLFTRQTFLHGDLNATNIAMDQRDDDVSAYIFDASGCAAGINVRDLALLEVSALLHQPLCGSESLIKYCSSLYGFEVAPPDEIDYTTGSDLARNTMKLIVEIRRQALKRAESSIYALMIFDNAVMQLGGLAFGSSCNKIFNPKEAAYLAALAARWLRRCAREILAQEEHLAQIEPA
jgi:CheY-like chemotaxis protein